MKHHKGIEDWYDASRLELQASVGGIRRGLQDVSEGRLLALEDFDAQMRQALAEKSREQDRLI